MRIEIDLSGISDSPVNCEYGGYAYEFMIDIADLRLGLSFEQAQVLNAKMSKCFSLAGTEALRRETPVRDETENAR